MGLEPGATGWKAQTNPLCYGGTHYLFVLFVLLFGAQNSNPILIHTIIRYLTRGVQQLMGYEGSCLPDVKLMCFWNAKSIETVHEGQKPNMFDNWADMSLHLLLLKRSMPNLMFHNYGRLDSQVVFILDFWTLVRYVQALVMTISFLDQAQHLSFIYDSIWFIWFDTIICLSNLSCELWNRKLKIKEIYF